MTVVFAVTLASPPSVDGTEVMEARWFAESEMPTSLVRGTYESLQAIGAVAPRVTR